MATALLVAVISASAAIVVPAVSFYLTKKKEQEADWRKYKFEQYRDFLIALSGIVGTDATPESQRRFALALDRRQLRPDVRYSYAGLDLYNTSAPSKPL